MISASTVVDVHCHTFNGDDLPVQGFVQRVLLDDVATLRLVSWALDRIGQHGTPGYEEERGSLDRLLSQQTRIAAPRTLLVQPTFEHDVENYFGVAQRERPDLVTAAEGEMTGNSVSPALIEGLSPAGALKNARRAIAWAVLLCQSRLEISQRLVHTYPEVQLFVPMTVDMAIGLKDHPEVSPCQQIELQEKISRLSMLGLLRENSQAKLHPFIGFDPRSEYRSRAVGDIVSSLDVVKSAIMDFGFVGIKLYPPMGFRPIDNVPTCDMDEQQARGVDEILRELYTWCADEDVPITAHCNSSNEARHDYQWNSSPQLWEKVLDRHGELRLNLGHFGGFRSEVKSDKPETLWPREIAELATRFPNVYADTGHHRIDDAASTESYFRMLSDLFGGNGPQVAPIKGRVMYGSDWLMLALVPDASLYLHRYRDTFEQYFGEKSIARFMGGAALEFLGLTDDGNKNRQRLTARYRRYQVQPPDWLMQ
ncbi:MAG: amidohydrolase family protein [Actinomycetota bacterium]